MGDREHTKSPREEHRPVGVEGLPDEEGVSRAEVAEGLDRTPDGQLNRTDQPDMTEEERRQYDDPPVEVYEGRSIAESDRPEDR